MNRYLFIVGMATALALSIAFAGCAAGQADEESVQTVTVIEEGAPAGESNGGGNGGGEVDGGKKVMPEVAGERLDVAEAKLDDLGIKYEEVGGGTFGVVNASNWMVCSTEPAAGVQVKKKGAKLIVARPGDCRGTDQGDDGDGDSNQGQVPDLVGLRLDVAESELDDAGIPYEEVGGGTFGVLNPSNWIVCETDPEAGEAASGVVKLIVDREC